MILPSVSIIISTLNAASVLEKCLQSVVAQDYPKNKIEMIVADGGSTDKTRKIAKKYTNKVYNIPDLLDLTKVKNLRGAQLNFGVKKSKGKIIFFPDADMTFEKKLMKEAVGLIIKNKLDALYIPETVVGKGMFKKIRNFERSFYNETCIDAVRITTKKIFLKINGFDEKNINFGPDDWDFTKKIRIITNEIGITGLKINHHEEDITLGKYLSKKKKYVDTFAGYIKKWGKNDADIIKQLGLRYRYFVVFTEKGKWKKLLKHPVLTIGMFCLKFLVGFNYLFKKKFRL